MVLGFSPSSPSFFVRRSGGVEGGRGIRIVRVREEVGERGGGRRRRKSRRIRKGLKNKVDLGEKFL